MTKETVTGNKPENSESMATPTDAKKADGQHSDHWVLSKEERAKGFIRPVRSTYVHLKCLTETTMPYACAETYARQPNFYGSTFCCHCKGYFPVGADGEFIWDEENKEKVGT